MSIVLVERHIEIYTWRERERKKELIFEHMDIHTSVHMYVCVLYGCIQICNCMYVCMCVGMYARTKKTGFIQSKVRGVMLLCLGESRCILCLGGKVPQACLVESTS